MLGASWVLTGQSGVLLIAFPEFSRRFPVRLAVSSLGEQELSACGEEVSTPGPWLASASVGGTLSRTAPHFNVQQVTGFHVSIKNCLPCPRVIFIYPLEDRLLNQVPLADGVHVSALLLRGLLVSDGHRNPCWIRGRVGLSSRPCWLSLRGR